MEQEIYKFGRKNGYKVIELGAYMQIRTTNDIWCVPIREIERGSQELTVYHVNNSYGSNTYMHKQGKYPLNKMFRMIKSHDKKLSPMAIVQRSVRYA